MSNVGFRRFTNINRPDKSIVELFRGLPTPNICDNMSRLYALSGLKPYNKAPLLGTAFTVKVPAGENLMFNHAIDLAQPGDVLVIDGGGSMERALCGEIMISHAKHRGLAGFIINGCIRDIDAIADMDFPVYALGANPNGPLKNGLGEINVPVVAGGMAILPGDILIGDADGIVVVRPQDAVEVAAKAAKQHEGEHKLLEIIAAGTWDRSSIATALAEKGCEII
ncbi:MAG TPA: RraA family protein [Clostridiales bacterium]|jgi:RraA family protein|nr:RraA family protein [Clostridiales bacterium]